MGQHGRRRRTCRERSHRGLSLRKGMTRIFGQRGGEGDDMGGTGIEDEVARRGR